MSHQQISDSKIEEVVSFRNNTKEIASNYIIGYDNLIDNILTSFLADGHVLLIGLPGLAKTLLVKTISSIWGLDFNRVQFTPDLLPSDIIGTEILQEKVGKNERMEKVFEFHQGPVFTNFLLADEINRTPPKTQSALLQAMEEKQITIAEKTYNLPQPFMVMATQNPIELEGTYPLPEAQLDRFLMSLNFEYPSREDEKKIALLQVSNTSYLKKIKAIASSKKISQWKSLVSNVLVPDSILDKLVDSIRNTRPESGFEQAVRFCEYGAGPRATQYLLRTAQSRALILGEKIVTEEIIKSIFHNVLRHRIQLNYIAIAEKVSIDDFLNDCLVFS